ncbi:MAG: hypothetical protein OEV33_07230 [Armatimonadota bacterium]|nr:hypothetical protein [Armatimonadota bacterium]
MAVSSRDRMLAAIDGAPDVHTPCSFMIFRALRERCRDEYEFATEQSKLGLDARVQLDDLPMRFSPEATVRESVEPVSDAPPLLHRTYQTPAGTLTATAKQTEDWPYGDRLPIFDDYFTPRAVKYPITGPDDLDALRCLLPPPADDDIAAFREDAARRKQFADQHGLLFTGGWKSQRFIPGEDKGLVGDNGGTGTVIDTLMWLCGGTEPLLWAYDQPDFLSALISLVEEWNHRRLEIHLDSGVDLIVRRAWYEGTDFWSPRFFRQFILPGLQREAHIAHQAGVRYGYIITTGMIAIADALLESGVDVLIGIDPGEGKDTTLADVRASLGGRVALWGGVSGPLVVEEGNEQDVRRAVEGAMSALAPTGRFILCPVDNLRADTDEAWHNLRVFIDTWKSLTEER